MVNFVSRGSSAARMLLACSVGVVAGQIVAAGASTQLGPTAFYAVDWLLMARFSVGVFVRLVSLAPVSQEDFVAVPRATFAVNELDPRTDPVAPDEPAVSDAMTPIPIATTEHGTTAACSRDVATGVYAPGLPRTSAESRSSRNPSSTNDNVRLRTLAESRRRRLRT